MSNKTVVEAIVTRAGRSILNMLEMGKYVGDWDGSLSELENATAAAGCKVSKGTLSKASTLFKHYGVDVDKVKADCVAADKEPTWKNAYDLLKAPRTVSEGNAEGEGDEGDGSTEVAPTTGGRFVKINLDDPLQALLKLSAEDAANLAKCIAAVLEDQAIKAA